jgi:hypothetical protein
VADGLDGDVVDHRNVVAAQLLAQQPAQLDVHGGHDGWGLLDQGDRQAAGGEGLGHLQADVATADDDGRAGASGQGLVEGEGVAHGVQHLDPGQVQAVDRGLIGTPPVAMTSWSEPSWRSAPAGSVTVTCLASGSMAQAVWLSRSRSPAASRSALVR